MQQGKVSDDKLDELVVPAVSDAMKMRGSRSG